MNKLKRERSSTFGESLSKKGRSYISPQAIRRLDLENPFHFEIICNEINCKNPDLETVMAIIPMLDPKYDDDEMILKKILENEDLSVFHEDVSKKLR